MEEVLLFRGSVGDGVVDVVLPVSVQPRYLVRGELFQLTGGAAGPEGAGGDDGAFEDYGTGGNQGTFADDAAAEDQGTDADEGPIAHHGGMDYRAMAHSDSVAQTAGIAVIDVEDDAILEIGVFANFDVLVVAAQYAAKPDRAAGSQGDAAVHDGPGRNPGTWVDLWGGSHGRPVAHRSGIGKLRG